jgi:hypothetical protein
MRHNKRRNKARREAAKVRLAEHTAAINARGNLSGLAFYGKLDPESLHKAQSTCLVVKRSRRRKPPVSE